MQGQELPECDLDIAFCRSGPGAPDGMGRHGGGKLGEHVHDYARYEVHMVMFGCTLVEGEVPYPATVADLRWVTSREFLDYEFPPADENTLIKLLGLMRN